MLIRLYQIKTIIKSVLIGTIVLFVSGCTTLHTAAVKGNTKAIDRLIGEGDDINALDDSGRTPLIQAINVNQQGSVASLLKSGANVNMADTVFGNTPLHHAIMQGSSKSVALLLSYKADITIQNHEKKSSLDFAQKSSSREISRLMENAKQKLLSEYMTTSIKDPEPLKIEPAKETEIQPLSVVIVQEDVIKTPSIPLSVIPEDAAQTLKGMISRYETRGIREYLNNYPQAITVIEDPKQRLRYLGSSSWRVIDIVENIEHKKMQEKIIIEHIKNNNIFYKKFTQEEIAILLKYGLSYKLINVMMQVD